jgi:hypothetical protein
MTRKALTNLCYSASYRAAQKAAYQLDTEIREHLALDNLREALRKSFKTLCQPPIVPRPGLARP